jgi:putative lipoprotein
VCAALLLFATSCEPGPDDQDYPPEQFFSEDPVPAGPGRVSPTSVYTCQDPEGDSFSFTVTELHMGPGELALWLPSRFGRSYEILAQGEGPGQLQYSADGIVFTPMEEIADLAVGGQRFEGCRLDRAKGVWEHAKLSGVDFRATGNEPGWHLEIRNDLEARAGKRIRFVFDYGERDAVLHAPDPMVEDEPHRTVYRGENGDLDIVVQIEGDACTDSMSGERFEATVTVEFQGKVYRGCGRALH